MQAAGKKYAAWRVRNLGLGQTADVAKHLARRLHHGTDGENPDGFELFDVLLPDAEILGGH
jgi:hypothetical protein